MINPKHAHSDQHSWYSLSQLQHLQHTSPRLFECVDIDRMLNTGSSSEMLKELEQSIDFDAESCGGRGGSYRHAQQNSLVRIIGIRQMFSLLSPHNNITALSPDYKILDVLGGDGTLTRALSTLLPPASMPSILTSDLSSDMVSAAQQYGLSSLRQPAQCLFLKPESFDAVIIAYGSHHIPRHQRLLACQEAWRVLKSGGLFVYHDFEEDSPVSHWFNQVVDVYSKTGHKFSHFTIADVSDYLSQTGFADVQVGHFYDPFLLQGESQAQVKQELSNYLFEMYGLTNLKGSENGATAQDRAYALAYQHFQYDYARLNLPISAGKTHITTYQQHDQWWIEMPRVALVGWARKK